MRPNLPTTPFAACFYFDNYHIHFNLAYPLFITVFPSNNIERLQ